MIIRRERRKPMPFTMIGNTLINDERLSVGALGLLVYLLSKPDDWEVHLNQLEKRFDCGRDKMRRLVNECGKFGYILSERVRRDESGRITGHKYVVVEQPAEMAEKHPSDGFPGGWENHPMGNRPLLKTNRDQELEAINKKEAAPASLKGSAAHLDSAEQLTLQAEDQAEDQDDVPPGFDPSPVRRSPPKKRVLPPGLSLASDTPDTTPDKYWALREMAESVGIRRSQMGQLLKVFGGDLNEASVSLLRATTRSDPSSYVAGIINNTSKIRSVH